MTVINHIQELLEREIDQINHLEELQVNNGEALLAGFRFGWQLANIELASHAPLTKHQLEIFQQNSSSLKLIPGESIVKAGFLCGMQQRFNT